jgi:hypothetical protein
MKKTHVFTGICAAVLYCSLTLAQVPVVDIDKNLFPNLAEAQSLVVQATQRVANAQTDPKNDFAGHADKARLLLVQVNQELRAAAQAALAAAKKKSNK